jgi:hypothetical protein
MYARLHYLISSLSGLCSQLVGDKWQGSRGVFITPRDNVLFCAAGAAGCKFTRGHHIIAARCSKLGHRVLVSGTKAFLPFQNAYTRHSSLHLKLHNHNLPVFPHIASTQRFLTKFPIQDIFIRPSIALRPASGWVLSDLERMRAHRPRKQKKSSNMQKNKQPFVV